MGRRLPPLNAIRAFEAAARHLSFTRAAEELNVTQAAISHQIKGLEDVLGMPLFRRLNRALMLTEAGQSYLPPLRDALDQIADATARLKAADSGGALTISTIGVLRREVAGAAPAPLSGAAAGNRRTDLHDAADGGFHPAGRRCGDPLRARRLGGREGGPAADRGHFPGLRALPAGWLQALAEAGGPQRVHLAPR